jgi:hypothetical protein
VVAASPVRRQACILRNPGAKEFHRFREMEHQYHRTEHLEGQGAAYRLSVAGTLAPSYLLASASAA